MRLVTLALALLLVALTLLAFWPALGAGFVNYDDPIFVSDNPHVLHGLDRAQIAWTWTHIYDGFWIPLTWLSYQVDAQLSGTGPAAFHRTNLILHACNALMLLLILRAMTASPWRSFLVAAAFAVHPLRAESVVWITERKDVLSTALWLLAMAGYIHYVRRPSIWRYLPIMAFTALALTAKPMLVTFPCVLLLLDYWPLSRLTPLAGGAGLAESVGARTIPWRRAGWLLLEKVPLLALCLAAGVAVIITQSHVKVVASLNELGVRARVANALISYARYIGKTFIPRNLSPHYDRHDHWPALWVAGAAALLVIVSVLVIWQWKRRPWLAVGWLWFLGTLLPVIGLLQSGTQAMADRYSYFAGIGLAIMVVFSLPGAFPRAGWRRVGPATAAGVAALALACLVGMTRTQTAYWHDSVTLFTHAVAVDPGSFIAQRNLGKACEDQGDLDAAVTHYRLAIELGPASPLPYNNLAVVLVRRNHRGDLRDAAQLLQAALKINPRYAEARINLGNVIAAGGDPRGAIEQFRQVPADDPRFAEAVYRQGLALAALGDRAGAIEQYRRALELRPDLADAHNSLGIALAQGGQLSAAIAEFSDALRHRPDFAAARENLAQAQALRREQQAHPPGGATSAPAP